MNNNIRTVRSESSTFASLLFDLVFPKTSGNSAIYPIWWYFAWIWMLFISSIVKDWILRYKNTSHLTCNEWFKFWSTFIKEKESQCLEPNVLYQNGCGPDQLAKYSWLEIDSQGGHYPCNQSNIYSLQFVLFEGKQHGHWEKKEVTYVFFIVSDGAYYQISNTVKPRATRALQVHGFYLCQIKLEMHGFMYWKS